jgi:hypothetical protein
MIPMKTTPHLFRMAGSLGLFLALLGGLSSCSDPIFYQIQYEKELNKDPTVPGGLTRIVQFNGALYTASGWLYRYDDAVKKWTRLPASQQPDGKKILDLAVAGDSLYALVSRGAAVEDTRLYRFKAGDTEWKTIIANNTGYTALQSLQGAAGDPSKALLFVGASKDSGTQRAVLYVQDTELKVVRETPSPTGSGGMLQGAAYFAPNYYLSIAGLGILAAASPEALGAASPLGDSAAAGTFTGFIPVGTHLIALTRNGTIWKIQGDTSLAASKAHSESDTVVFTGALALWTDPEDPTVQILLVGRNTTTSTYYTYGYYELAMDSGGELDIETLLVPGKDSLGRDISHEDSTRKTSSVAKNETYASSIGTHAVTSLLQAPSTIDTAMPLFAATQQNGLWSCRAKEWDIE